MTLASQLGQASLGSLLASIQDHHAVTETLRHLEQMGRDQHAGARRRALAHQVLERPCSLGVEALERLVEQQQGRIVEQRHRH